MDIIRVTIMFQTSWPLPYFTWYYPEVSSWISFVGWWAIGAIAFIIEPLTLIDGLREVSIRFPRALTSVFIQQVPVQECAWCQRGWPTETSHSSCRPVSAPAPWVPSPLLSPCRREKHLHLPPHQNSGASRQQALAGEPRPLLRRIVSPWRWWPGGTHLKTNLGDLGDNGASFTLVGCALWYLLTLYLNFNLLEIDGFVMKSSYEYMGWVEYVCVMFDNL